MTRAKPVTQRALFLAQEGPEHGIFFTSSIADIGSPVRHIIRGNSSSLKKKVEIEKEAMGRAERVRKNKERAKTNPIASSGRSATAVDSSQHNALRQEKILPVVKDLTSVNANERTHAIKAIANLVEDEVCRKLLLREKLVQIIMEQTINDSEAEAVLWGWGALRNLAVEEGYVMCMHMYRKDILTPILVAISKIQTTLNSLKTNPSSIDATSKKLIWPYVENIVGLLTSLSSETASEVVEAITNQPTIIPFLFTLLEPTANYPRAVQSSSATCLQVLSEDNGALVETIIRAPECISVLNKLRDGPFIFGTENAPQLLRTAAICGVAHNIYAMLAYLPSPEGKEGDYVSRAAGLFADSTTLSRLNHVVEVGSKGASGPTTNGSGKSSNTEEMAQEEPLEAIQVALEVIASIATAVQEELEGIQTGGAAVSKKNEAKALHDDDKMDEDEDEEGDGEEEDEKEDQENDLDEENDDHMSDTMADEIAMVTAIDRSDSRSPSPEDRTGSMVHTLLHTTIKRILPLCSSPLTPAIHLRALNCLNNIAWVCTTYTLPGGPENRPWTKRSHEIWETLITPVLTSNTADISLAEAITGLSWAVAKHTNGNLSLTQNQHKAFMALYSAASTPSNAPSEDLKTKCIGTLGSLALPENRIQINKEIGTFFLQILASLPTSYPTSTTSPPTIAAPITEALNALFDIYGDASHDYDEPAFVQGGFLAHLEAAIPRVKAVVRRVDKSKYPEERRRGDEAVVNLVRFVAYKRKEAKLPKDVKGDNKSKVRR